MDAAVPDPMAWDGRAEPGRVRLWLEALRQRPRGAEHRALEQLSDERAAPVLREHLDDTDRHVADVAVYALGGCGSREADGPRLLAMARASQQPSEVLLGTLTELEVPGTVDLLHELLQRVEPGSREELLLLKRLTWLRDASVADRLLQLVRERGPYTVPAWRFDLAAALLRVGDAEHRAQLADIAVGAVAKMLEIEPVDPRSRRLISPSWEQWHGYHSAATTAGAPELAGVLARVEALVGDRPFGYGIGALPVVEEYTERVVPSSWMRLSDGPSASSAWPPAKFLGQPDWREEPAWPLTAAGEPLSFYAQLPLPGDRTAYIFLDGPEEWQPLGPGNAVVVQPGNLCHLPTAPLRHARQDYVSRDRGTYRHRWQGIPRPSVFVELVPSSDPLSWDNPVPAGEHARDDERYWNKIGGTPRWLQGEEYPPGEGWAFLAQFVADSFGGERGDGAVCYLWQHPDGRVAFGWQCH